MSYARPDHAPHAASCDPLWWAWQVLFHQGPPGLDTLTPLELKRAFRRRALECHPDRAGVTGRAPASMAREFQQVQQAHDILRTYLRTGTVPVPVAAPAARPRPNPSLRFGEFLVQTGRVNEQTLQAALAWQARDRPPFGALAVRWGVLSEARLASLLQRRRPDEPIAAAAVRLGFLTQSRAEAILSLQCQQQKPLGIYLVALGAFPYHELQRQLDDHARYRAAA